MGIDLGRDRPGKKVIIIYIYIYIGIIIIIYKIIISAWHGVIW